jgi:hypothetical protein
MSYSYDFKTKEQKQNIMKTIKRITWKRLNVKTVKKLLVKLILRNIY